MLGKIVEVTPTISTSAYASGDQLGGLMTIAKASRSGGHMAFLEGVVVIDRASQNAEIDIYLFDEEPTVASSDNAEADISDTELVDKCIGYINVGSGQYKDLANNSVAKAAYNLNYVTIKPVKDSTIYALAVVRGTPTYTSTSDIIFKFITRWDTI